MKGRPGEYSEAEDAEVIAAARLRVPQEVTAEKLGRSSKSIQQRVFILRREGRIPRYDGARLSVAVSTALSANPGIDLGRDDRLVDACLAEGGFPTAYTFRGRTYWLNGGLEPWQHQPRAPRSRRAA